MVSLFLSLLMGFWPVMQAATIEMPYEIRAKRNLLFGTGDTSQSEYWDVVITRRPSDGVLIKLPYTTQGGRFTFDLHHRIPMSEDFGLPAEVTTVVEVLTGGTTSVGVFTISTKIEAGTKFEESITKISTAEIDRYVTPLTTKTITLDIRPGPQSISVVGRRMTVTRGDLTTRVDTPGIRIASVSNFKFEEVTELNPLKPTLRPPNP